jgi:hypothetical protein
MSAQTQAANSVWSTVTYLQTKTISLRGQRLWRHHGPQALSRFWTRERSSPLPWAADTWSCPGWRLCLPQFLRQVQGPCCSLFLGLAPACRPDDSGHIWGWVLVKASRNQGTSFYSDHQNKEGVILSKKHFISLCHFSNKG